MLTKNAAFTALSASFLCITLALTSCSKGSKVNFSDSALTTNPPTTSSNQTTSVRLMDRMQLANTLYEITKPDGVVSGLLTDGSTSFKTNYFSRISGLASFNENSFGRPCIQHEILSTNPGQMDYNCGSNLQADNVVPPNTTSRETSRISLCEGLATWTTSATNNGKTLSMGTISNFKARIASVAKLSSPTLLTFTVQNSAYVVSDSQKPYLNTAYQLFYPDRTASDDLIKTLVGVVTNSDASTTDSPWLNVFVTLCYSPEWQTL